MHSLLLVATLAVAAAPLDEATPALQARVLAGLDRPQAIADLFRVYERRDADGELGPLLMTLEKVAKSPRARADVRALATEMRGELAIAQGQLPRAAASFDQVAPIRTWSIIGPFENDGRSWRLAQYPPEKEGYDPKAVYAGKEHDVTWRALPQGHAPYGFVDLSAAVYPRSDVAVYAATVLRAAQAQAVVFHFGASGATRVWLNGKLVHEDPAVHPSRFDQRSFAGELRAGDNFLLLKIAHNHGRLGFSLRVADAKDLPLVALAKAALAPQAKAPAFAATSERGRLHPSPVKKPVDAWDELRAAAAASPRDARAQEDLAVLLQWRRPTDDTERMPLRAMERVTDLVPTEPEAALRLARLEDRDANKRRGALETALAAHPEDAALLDALANYRLDRAEGWAALDLARKARASAPRRVDPMLTEARALDAVGLSARAAELLSENGRVQAADEAYAQALALAPDDPEPHEQLGRHRLRAKDDSGALAAFTRALSLRPQNPALRELVRSIRPEERYAAPYLYDAKHLAKLSPIAGEDVEVLADLAVVKVFANGL